MLFWWPHKFPRCHCKNKNKSLLLRFVSFFNYNYIVNVFCEWANVVRNTENQNKKKALHSHFERPRKLAVVRMVKIIFSRWIFVGCFVKQFTLIRTQCNLFAASEFVDWYVVFLSAATQQNNQIEILSEMFAVGTSWYWRHDTDNWAKEKRSTTIFFVLFFFLLVSSSSFRWCRILHMHYVVLSKTRMHKQSPEQTGWGATKLRWSICILYWWNEL